MNVEQLLLLKNNKKIKFIKYSISSNLHVHHKQQKKRSFYRPVVLKDGYVHLPYLNEWIYLFFFKSSNLSQTYLYAILAYYYYLRNTNGFLLFGSFLKWPVLEKKKQENSFSSQFVFLLPESVWPIRDFFL
jgi:hypothetical protein